jgi:hypothetical protein
MQNAKSKIQDSKRGAALPLTRAFFDMRPQF